ncbi:universal stress protein [Nakamurella aerolata]|uniref:Universal stress protein n=1 Tax=Nakamurella aerolata TaxID=1656892 RepID=A0A849AC14_9ACTN|nr:universal stress protein [Nakamurella aerolata]NNG37136.1 universal stress protein [Nakamurella aerolata]
MTFPGGETNSHGLPIPPDLADGPVIVGVDEASTCGRPLRAAVFLSLALDRPLLLVHVRRRSMPMIEGYVPVPEETPTGERVADEIEAELVESLKQSNDLAGVRWELVTTVGDAAAELGRIAGERDAACVVVGKRNKGFAELVHRITSGSVSRAMVAANRWPVLVVP